jgi:hypothetical protein
VDQGVVLGAAADDGGGVLWWREESSGAVAGRLLLLQGGPQPGQPSTHRNYIELKSLTIYRKKNNN